MIFGQKIDITKDDVIMVSLNTFCEVFICERAPTHSLAINPNKSGNWFRGGKFCEEHALLFMQDLKLTAEMLKKDHG